MQSTQSISNATRYIITILATYQKLNDTQLLEKEKQQILNELLNKTNAVKLIDNFNIVLDDETNDIETIYQMILNQINNNNEKIFNNSSSSICNVTLCNMIQRNNRDRLTKYQLSQVYYGVKEDEQIVLIQLLDKIHCYFMHSFDFGLKFTKNETNYIFQTGKSMKVTSQSQQSLHNDITPDPMLKRVKEIIDKKKYFKTLARFDENRYVTKMNNNNIDERKKMTMTTTTTTTIITTTTTIWIKIVIIISMIKKIKKI